jgi:Na+-transporting methylmalonyl-CoA/oxaloacetate decarboxylase gamma subunit
MDDMLWGLQMMGVGMGTVFALLLALMGLLMLIGRLDRPSPAPAAVENAPAKLTLRPDPEGGAAVDVDVDGTGFTADTIAAISVAVMTHAEHRRRLAAPEVRAHEPGSQVFASRWVTVGRGNLTQPFRRK